MEGENNVPNAAPPTPRRLVVDGGINFSAYTLAQLQELQYSIDPQAFPQNYQNLLTELERRRNTAEQPPEHHGAVTGRFTRLDGLRGWLQAKITRSPLYGFGSIEARPPQVLLRGWQRTWLGVPVQAEVAVPASSIRYAVRDGVGIRLTCKSPYLGVRQIEFEAVDNEQAARLIADLTAAATFDQRWSDIGEFYARLRRLCPRVWITPALVLLNVAIYIAMVVPARRLGAFDPQLLMSWGANYGPLTINGQWWRLISAIFVHLNLLHLLLNMWALWNIGRLAERLYGRWVFFALYIATGGLASLSSIAWNPTHLSAGASGAIFGSLGAFLAFLVRRRSDVPRTIIRSHWISTLAFVLFNIVSSALQPGIDNAAHVGGLVSGMLLGYVLARPLDFEHRRRMTLAQTAGAATLVAVALLAGLWQVRGIGAELTGPEQFYRIHGWYVSGEGANLRLWQQLAQQAASGTISDAELGRRFQQDILPFWQSASERLHKENQAVEGSQRPIGLLVEEFAHDRAAWAQALIDAAIKSDSERGNDARNLAEQTDLVQARLERLWLRTAMVHRSRALANSALVVQVRRMLSLDRWTCVEGPAYGSAPVSTHDARDDAPARRQAIACQAQRLFMTGDYASLDALLKRSAQHQADLPDGSSSYSAIVGGLTDLFRYGKLDVAEALGRVADWRRGVQDSLAPDTVEALLFSEWAWSARGSDYANAVTPQAFALFKHRTEMAAAALSDTAARAESSPLWYQLSLNVGLDQSIEARKLRDIFDRGVAAFPAYLPLYSRMLRSLMPRWGGSYEAVDQFITDVSNRTSERLRSETYARLYWMYGLLEGDDVDIFSDAQALWPIMQSGFEDMSRRYPQSDYVLNVYVNFACRAEDKATYQALRPRVITRKSASAWSEKYSIENCDKRFATAAAVASGATRNTGEPPISTGARARALRSFGGITLGASPGELVKAKGAPVMRTERDHWVYNSIDAAHDGLLDVFFNSAAGEHSGSVAAVLFSGKEDAAPRGLPNLLGASREELVRQFGEPTYAPGPRPGGEEYIGFRNGIIVLMASGKTSAYGLYTPQPPAPH